MADLFRSFIFLPSLTGFWVQVATKIFSGGKEKKHKNCWAQRQTPSIPALRRQEQEDVYEFEASMLYIVSFRPGRAT